MPLGSLAIEIENCNFENNGGAILSNDSSIKKIIKIETFSMEKLLKQEEEMNRFYLLMIASLIFILSSCGNIWYSAKTGNIEGIEKSLDQGISIESKSQAGNTPLIIAAYSRNVETVEYLCKRGANVNAQGANGATALIHAAYYDFYDVAEILVKYHADKNIKDIYGHTALYYASQFEHPRIISLLKGE
jgi:ankyrin repeat protein